MFFQPELIASFSRDRLENRLSKLAGRLSSETSQNEHVIFIVSTQEVRASPYVAAHILGTCEHFNSSLVSCT